LIEIIKAEGDNTFKLPNIGKNKLEGRGQLPEEWPCDPALVERSRWLLDEEDQLEHMEKLNGELMRNNALVELCTLLEDAGIDSHDCEDVAGEDEVFVIQHI
jgi:hypothetical protein